MERGAEIQMRLKDGVHSRGDLNSNPSSCIYGWACPPPVEEPWKALIVADSDSD